MRTLDFSDGFTSNVEPNLGSISSSSMQSHLNDAAFVTAKGSAATVGNQYYNTTLSKIRVHNGSAFENVAEEDSVVNLTDNQGAIGGNKTFTNNVTVSGDFTVSGTTTTLNTQDLDVEDKNITVNKSGNDASAEGAGLTIDRTGTDGSIKYEDALTTKFKVGALGSEKEVADVSSVQDLYFKSILTTSLAGATAAISTSTGTSSGSTSGDYHISTGNGATEPDRGVINLDAREVNFLNGQLTGTVNDKITMSLGYTDTWYGTPGGAVLYNSSLTAYDHVTFGSSDTSATTHNTKDVVLGTGALTGASAFFTGQTNIITGDVTNAASTNGSGIIYQKTGMNSGLGPSGKIYILTGQSVNAYSGDIEIQTGPAGTTRGFVSIGGEYVTHNTTSTKMAEELVNVKSNYNSYFNGGVTTGITISHPGSDFVVIGTPDVDEDEATDNIALQTGANSGAGAAAATGGMAIFTGDHVSATGTGITGQLDIYSGYSYSANAASVTGDLNIQSGNATGGTAGHALFASGNGAITQFAQLSSGNASAGNSGDVNIFVGTASGTRGSVKLDGLTVDLVTQARITNLSNPTSAQDAATKAYVDSAVTPVATYVRVYTSNGHGSTNTKIRRFTNTATSTNNGTVVTYADSAANGASITAVVESLVTVSYTDGGSLLGDAFGLSLNSAQLTTNADTITDSDRLALEITPVGNYAGHCSWSGVLQPGDVLRPHTSGTTMTATGQITMSVSAIPVQ